MRTKSLPFLLCLVLAMAAAAPPQRRGGHGGDLSPVSPAPPRHRSLSDI